METRGLSFALGLAFAAAVACQPSDKGLKTETFEYADSTAHADLSIRAELPVPAKGAAEQIRAKLVEVMDAQLSHIGSYGEERLFPAFEGDSNDSEALMGYYRSQSLETIGRFSQEDFEERVESLDENDGITEEEKAEILADMPGWEYAFSLTKNRETDRYVVFLSEDYVYLGGAHGGVLGRGPLTFDKKDGHLVTDFLDPGCLEAIQPLLRKGIATYFTEGGEETEPENVDGYLMLENGMIPFPAWAPCPGEDGLIFTYQQYEIAAYAAGMPSFTVPYGEILPYLTPEAKALLGL